MKNIGTWRTIGSALMEHLCLNKIKITLILAMTLFANSDTKAQNCPGNWHILDSTDMVVESRLIAPKIDELECSISCPVSFSELELNIILNSPLPKGCKLSIDDLSLASGGIPIENWELSLSEDDQEINILLRSPDCLGWNVSDLHFSIEIFSPENFQEPLTLCKVLGGIVEVELIQTKSCKGKYEQRWLYRADGSLVYEEMAMPDTKVELKGLEPGLYFLIRKLNDGEAKVTKHMLFR